MQKKKTNRGTRTCNILLLIILLMLAPCIMVVAQDPGGLDDDPGVQAPIDGGVSLLIAAGVAYGAKKAHEHRKKQREAEQDKLKM